MRITLHEYDRLSRQRNLLLDCTAAPGHPARGSPLTLRESSELILRLYHAGPAPAARVKVGTFLVASTAARDRPDFRIQPAEEPSADGDYLVCSGRLLRDWVGLTDLTVEVADEDRWRPVLTAEVRVTAGKIQQEEFQALFVELEAHSAAVLLDTYGKTFVGLAPGARRGDTAPAAVLHGLHATVSQLDDALRRIAHQPAYRLKASRAREPVLAGQAISELTLEEACTDPNLLTRRGGRLYFREQVRELATPNYDLPEHTLLAGFLAFLAVQSADLRQRLLREVQLRQERRAFRNYHKEAGTRTWWEEEDLPRLQELRRLLAELDALDRDVARLRRHVFLPPAKPLTQVPPSTPLIRAHQAYADAYRIVLRHFQAYRVSLDNSTLLAQARSLPLLYEWWCVLRVILCLQGCLRQRGGDPGAASPFRRLTEERTRFLVEFAPDQVIDFEDDDGRLVRFRYQPRYRSLGNRGGAEYGLLGPGSERTPDMALEVFRSLTPDELVPDLIVVLDAKYTSASQQEKLDEVRQKYDKIGVFRTGTLLSRQVWALTPSGAASSRENDWRACCTVDNLAFWSDAFDMASPVSGAVQARPLSPLRPSPLESLLRLLLTRCGLRLRDGQGAPSALHV